jgi:hypothetical protein
MDREAKAWYVMARKQFMDGMRIASAWVPLVVLARNPTDEPIQAVLEDPPL